MNFIEELRWRGLLDDTTPGIEEKLKENRITGYVGFDPTAPSLGIGNLVPIMLLVHFQRHGHKPIALVGGSTGMIGDPSGKKSERTLLNEEILQQNVEGVKLQLSRFLKFDSSENGAILLNNYEWMKDYTFLGFLRDVGKHLSVNYMIAKDSVKSRMETGISFTEFSYQLLQGYDFYWLFKNYNCLLQMGGSDQWGNMTTGTELIRRMGGGEAWCLTCPLVTRSDGTKFGKSESGNVWLDASMTSPYKFYQFWLNVTDQDARKFIKIYTLLDRETIEQLISEHDNEPEKRILQKELAKQVTIMVHGLEACNAAATGTQILFGQGTYEQLINLSEEILMSALEGVPQIVVKRESILSMSFIDILTSSTDNNSIFQSKGEARKMLTGGGVRINKNKVGVDFSITQDSFISGKYILVQKGKKDYYLIIIKE